MLAKKTSKNQITLPKKVLKRLPETDYFDVSVEKENIVLRPVKISSASTLENVRKKVASLGLTEDDIAEAIKWARRHN